jgi:hypothetical protein
MWYYCRNGRKQARAGRRRRRRRRSAGWSSAQRDENSSLLVFAWLRTKGGVVVDVAKRRSAAVEMGGVGPVIDYTTDCTRLETTTDERDVFPSFPPKERLACVDPASQLPGPAGPTLACPRPDPCTSNPHHPARLRQSYRPLHSTRRAGCHLCLATSKTSSRCEPK